MRLSINGRVVKSYDVEVLTPRVVECLDGFQKLGTCLAVVNVGEETKNAETLEPISWVNNPKEAETREEVERTLAEANEQAERILTEAKEQAAKILAEAKEDAQEILVQAETDLDRLRQEVIESAQAEVYPAAQAEGYREGRQAGETEGNRLIENANLLFRLAERAVQEEYAKVDKELLHLAIKIAERIVRSSIALDPQRLVAIIQALILLPQERTGWRLHVAPEDAKWLEQNQFPCPWVVNESLASGDCFMECEEGVFDARLEAQLDKLEHTLREELEHGGVETFNSDGQ